jgi:hypothetical protein
MDNYDVKLVFREPPASGWSYYHLFYGPPEGSVLKKKVV